MTYIIYFGFLKIKNKQNWKQMSCNLYFISVVIIVKIYLFGDIIYCN